MKKDYWRLRIMSWRCTATSVMAMTFGICRTPCRALASYIPMAHHFKPAPVDAEHFRSVWNAFATEDFGVSMFAVPQPDAFATYMSRKQQYYVDLPHRSSSLALAEIRFAMLANAHHRYNLFG